MALKGSKTEQNLKDAFAGESQANRRYLYFANKADVEGQNDVAMLFRSTAEGETGHAHGHLEFLENGSGDPATGLPIGSSRQNLAAAVAGETHEYTDMYPGMAKQARDEGFDEIADWFETLAKAERQPLPEGPGPRRRRIDLGCALRSLRVQRRAARGRPRRRCGQDRLRPHPLPGTRGGQPRDTCQPGWRPVLSSTGRPRGAQGVSCSFGRSQR